MKKMGTRTRYTFLFVFCNLFISIALCTPLISKSDYRVSTEPAPAHILLEEFTGLHCSYCPQAHVIANNLTYVAGENVHVMAVHVGNLAAPAGSEVDLRCKYGQTLFSWQGESGMPSGNINRTKFSECIGESYSLPRTYWAAVAKRLMKSGPAPVNLFAEAHLDTLTRNMEIVVEGYMVWEVSQPLYINVAITENFVPGTQAGNPIQPYLHRHVLRDLVTGLNGDSIRATERKEGIFFRRTYNYKLPETYNNREPNMANLACLAFVTDSGYTVINSTETEVESVAKAPLDYLQINLHALEKIYGGSVFEVYVVNPSDELVDNLEFTLDIDGETRPYTLNDVQVFPKTESVVYLKTDFEASGFQNTNVYTLRLIKANGREVKSNMVKDSFKKPLLLSSSSFKVSFLSDLFGSENTLCITKENGDTVYSAGPFEDGVSKVYESEQIDAEPGEVYTLRVRDAFRDGAFEMPEGTDAGDVYTQIRLKTASDSVFYTASVGTYGHTVSFGRPSSENVCNENSASAGGVRVSLQPNPAQTQTTLHVEGLTGSGPLSVRIYNLQGRMLETKVVSAKSNHVTVPLALSYPQGLYLVRVERNDLRQVVKLVITDTER